MSSRREGIRWKITTASGPTPSRPLLDADRGARFFLPIRPRHVLRSRQTPMRVSRGHPWLGARFRCTVVVPPREGRTAEDDMKGCWWVRFGDALAWIDAPSEATSVRPALDLHRLGNWTDDARNLVIFPQHAYPHNSGSHGCTRAALNVRPPSGRLFPSPGVPRTRTRALHVGPCSPRCWAFPPFPQALDLFRCALWLFEDVDEWNLPDCYSLGIGNPPL